MKKIIQFDLDGSPVCVEVEEKEGGSQRKWHPLKECPSVGECEDIAVLELTVPLPNEAQPIPVVILKSQAFSDRRIKLFGADYQNQNTV
jgi:hypothetical protein